MLPNNQEITEEILKIHRNKWQWKHSNPKPIWDAAKAVQRGKFTAIQSHLRKQEKSHINNLTLHLATRETRTKEN